MDNILLKYLSVSFSLFEPILLNVLKDYFSTTVVVESDEIDEVKEYVHLRRMIVPAYLNGHRRRIWNL